MPHIVHIITGLSRGGAETNLAQLVAGMDRSRFRNTVIAAIDGGAIADTITAAGIPVHFLGMRRGIPDPRGLLRLARLLRGLRPDAIQTWLYHGDAIGLLAAQACGRPPVLWNVRCSNMDLRQYGAVTRWLVHILAKLSPLPAAVLVNSEAGLQQHVQIGYRPRRWELVPNGFDTDRLKPDPAAGPHLRRDLGLPEDAFILGHVARVDPMKDHAGFLAAVATVVRARDDIHAVLIGKGTEALTDMVAQHGLTGRVHLLGERGDVARLMPGFDLFCLSSAFGEGFPTVIGEAMACGIPCVATDVGDAARIIADCGRIVPPGQPDQLAAALLDLANAGPDALEGLRRTSRTRIESVYSLAQIIRRYEAIYQAITTQR